MAEDASPIRRRTVATRVLLSYALVTAAFALTAGWAVLTLRSAAGDADLMRSGYLPLSLGLRDAVASQDTWNTQLNHITTAKNPADKRVWFEIALTTGRPKMFGEVRALLNNAFMSSANEGIASIGRGLATEATGIEKFLDEDRELLKELFAALDSGDLPRAEARRDQLVTRGIGAKKRLSELEARVELEVDKLLEGARARERLAIRLLVALALFGLAVGVLMALYARRVLKPLGAVTARANMVARGDLTARPVVASNDEIGELAATFESMVDAIKTANEQLVASERLATIGKMAAHVTHEIRNPLSSMALNVELLEDELSAEQKEAAALTRAIKNEVDRLTALSQEYLSVARRQQLRLDEEDVGQVVREAHDFVRAELAQNGVQTELSIDEDLPTLRVDEAQLKQAIYNLMRNAREAMPDGGRVALEVKRGADDGVDVVVEDEGSGIDEATRARLFEPFFTTKEHGTGLGLAITRQIVEGHGGRIACEPAPSGGTRFSIYLPGSAFISPNVEGEARA